MRSTSTSSSTAPGTRRRSLRPELKERCFAVFSFGKTYHATGWKLGYCVAPPALTAELRRVHQYVTFASTSPLQQALAEYMTQHPEHHVELPSFYQERRDYFTALLSNTKFRLRRAAGTYFQLADYGAISTLARRRVRALAHDRARRGHDPDLGVLSEPAGYAARAVLFRQGERDARRRRGALAAALAVPRAA
jgi:aspartate/methionine/tyrosine aminotransferase